MPVSEFVTLPGIVARLDKLEKNATVQNSTINVLKSENAELKSEITGLKSENTALKWEVAVLKLENAGLDSRVTGLESRVTFLDGEVDEWITAVFQRDGDIRDLKSHNEDLQMDFKGIMEEKDEQEVQYRGYRCPTCPSNKTKVCCPCGHGFCSDCVDAQASECPACGKATQVVNFR
ncbi:MAG: hypothetical protein SGILL_007824 [Bacillariaceae sp.]